MDKDDQKIMEYNKRTSEATRNHNEYASKQTLEIMNDFATKRQEDHDLLIELKTNVENIRKDIRDLKDGTTARIECLEKDKANKDDVEILQKVNGDIEIRVRDLEKSKVTYITMTIIASGVMTTMIGIILYHMFTGS